MADTTTSSDDPIFKPRICTWEDLSYTEAESLLKTNASNKSLYNQLSSLHLPGIISISAPGPQEAKVIMDEKRNKITFDLFYNMVLFSRKNDFNPEQLTALFTIFKSMHLFCISTPYDNMNECFQLVQDFIVKHSVFRPPYSICLFNLHEVKLVSEYILQTYFKHYKLYKYAFTKRILLDLHITYDREEEQSSNTENEKKTGIESEEGQPEDVPAKESDAAVIEETQSVEEPPPVEDTLSDEQRHLKDIITQQLNDQMKEMKGIVEKEISLSDKRLVDRLSVLEAEVGGDKGKGKKKK